ncbi:hypothetical protein [Aetokthonos hydrillicola]|uniref:hypothetical protein n=1 Tax=Aetokthonos hydrillicola TaxID=1550245 RepID=UPI0030D76FEC
MASTQERKLKVRPLPLSPMIALQSFVSKALWFSVNKGFSPGGSLTGNKPGITQMLKTRLFKSLVFGQTVFCKCQDYSLYNNPNFYCRNL